jgi:hypothetical protein
MFAEMQEAMEATKCSYIGSANLTENIDAVSIPQSIMSMVTDASDVVLKETLRDFGLAQTFRRDIYRRGVLPLTPIEHAKLLDGIGVVWTGRVAEDPIMLNTPMGMVQGLPDIYGPLMDLVMAGPVTIGSIRRNPNFARRSLVEISQAISLLFGAGYAHPVVPEAVQTHGRAATQALNTAIMTMQADGIEIGRTCSPVSGTEVPLDAVEILVLQSIVIDGRTDIDVLTDRTVAGLAQSGRMLQKNGQVVTDTNSMETFLGQRLPTLRRLGIVG